MTPLSRKNWILLALLTLAWGINWPIMKIAVRDFPPLTFRAASMLIGLPAIWLATRFRGESLAIPTGKFKDIVVLAIPNMLVWHVCIILGVKMLSSGRAAILGYTMPVWATLSGLLLFKERPSRPAWIGVGCALAGALLLLSSELGALTGKPLGSVLVLIGAAGWGYGTVLLRHATIRMPPLALTFWMLLITALVVSAAAVIFEMTLWRMPTAIEWGAILFNGVIVFGFAQVVWFILARTLTPVVSSLSVMMVPVIGVFSGAWLLGEIPHWQDYAAMLLILVAMSMVLLKPRGMSHK